MSAPKAFGSLLRRALQEHQSDESGPSDNSASSSSNSNDMPEAEFNPRLFWGINIFLFLLALSVCCCCWRFQRYDLSFLSGGGGQRESAVLERRRAAEERREETPEKRQAQLAASFARNKVTMVVEESDLRDEITELPQGKDESPVVVVPCAATADEADVRDDTTIRPADDVPRSNSTATETDLTDDVEAGMIPIVNDDEALVAEDQAVDECETGYLVLRASPGSRRHSQRPVPNCCAICLGSYEVGETVVWSSNRHCKHAFHGECMMDWLTKMRDGTPCPCCRQDFTDLKAVRKEKKINWDPTNSFNPRAIVLR